jgi:RNA polymerase sigma-70 factor (ECF subfamily)
MLEDKVKESGHQVREGQTYTDEMQENAYNEVDLFLRISEGEEPAFRRLFEMYRERLFIFASQISHSTVDAEEIVQDIFLKLWENRTQLSHVSYPRKYIYTMARNRALDHLTSIARNKKAIEAIYVNITGANNATEELLQAQESQQLIYKALAKLPEKKQTIFWLSRRDGLTHQEIAQRMNMSVQTVKNNLTDILKYVRIYLSGHSEILAIAFLAQTSYQLFQDSLLF